MTLVIVPSVNCFQHSFFCVSDCIKGCSLRTWMHHAFNKRDSYAATQWQKSDTHATEIYIIYIYILYYIDIDIYMLGASWTHTEASPENLTLSESPGWRHLSRSAFPRETGKSCRSALGSYMKLRWGLAWPCCVLRDLYQSHPVTSSHSHHPEVWIAVAVKVRSINFPLLQLLNCRLQRFLRQSKLHIWNIETTDHWYYIALGI